MSIWSSFFTIDAAYRVDYRLGDPDEHHWVDLATAKSWYGSMGILLAPGRRLSSQASQGAGWR